jgi:hypothetical protein
MRKLVPTFDRRKPERHFRQMQKPRLRPQRTTEPLSAKERRAMLREPARR